MARRLAIRAGRGTVAGGATMSEPDAADRRRTLSEAELRGAIDTAIDGMIVIDRAGTVLLYNRACERLFGYAAGEVLGRNIGMLMPSPHRERHDAYLRDYLRTGTAKIIGIGREVAGRRKDGSTFPMRLSVGELGGGGPLFVGTIHDLTGDQRARERIEELQTELMRVSRASALGEMGSALAHELNQPLSAIAGFVEAGAALIDRGEARTPKAREFMDKAVAQTRRAGDVIRRLQAFSRKGEAERTVEDINAVIEETCVLATLGTAADEIDIVKKLAPDLPPVVIDSIQIQQVVLNLVRNSIDALEGRAERRIEVATGLRGDRVEVAVSDTGPGLAPGVERRLFEPFVSTKPGGIGIGLSICRTIVETHGGEIACDTGPGAGTCFSFTVPVLAAAGD